MDKMEVDFTRYDYLQIGLNSKECLKIMESAKQDDVVQLVVGGLSGVLQSHKVKGGRLLDTMFKTVPGPSSKITAVELVEGAPKVFSAVGSLTIRGMTRKGKQFFGLELNNLTEPIEHLKLRWPTDIFVCGNYFYNHYILSQTAIEANIVHLKDSYICPGAVTAMIVLSDNHNHVPVLACQDRLLRLLRESKCEFELETSGIPMSLVDLSHVTPEKEFAFCYGSSDGKVTMVCMKQDAGSKPYSRWDFPESGVRSPVECLTVSSFGKEMVVGRSDGTIEVWGFNGTLNLDGSENVDFDSIPFLRFTYNCGESITSLCITRDSNLIVACTFAGSVFGLECKLRVCND
jgi:Bardet-Biedl syndrome 7 protein